MSTKFLKIQMAQTIGVLPYPYWIDPETGDVQRQEFWKGSPSKLIGFVAAPSLFDMALSLDDFSADPAKAVGLFPVFEHANGEWYTHAAPCDVTA